MKHLNRLTAIGLLLFSAAATHAANPPANGVLREVWMGIPGVVMTDLTGHPDFPNRPTTTNYVTDLFEAPTDVLDEYGQRLHGYIIAPRTGGYTFWIASDDAGSLLLSTDEDPAKAREIAWVSGWTSSREWTREPNQQSQSITLQAGRAYYISALMKEGWGGDNLAVRWRMPDGTDQAPIVATNLLPYGVSFSAPVITEHPTNTTVVEGGIASFRVRLSTVGLYSYQWQRNGSPIAGATSPDLAYGPVKMTDHNARFRCVVTNNLGTATSSEAVLTVTPDTIPPTLAGVQNVGTTQLVVTFSEAVQAASATQPGNYQLNNGVTVSGASPGASPDTVVLVTSAMTYGTTYTLTVNNVRDNAQTPNTIAPNSKITFVAAEYAPVDIGSPTLAGNTLSVPGGVDVTGAGKTIGGTADQFQFGWQQRSGNFDFQARLEGVTISDPFLHAGLMARESLEANVRFAAAFASSPQLGCFFESRGTLGASATTAAPRNGFPVNYPHTWLRLQRVGNTFTGYASLDGRVWTLLGSATLTGVPNSVYLGFAVSSDNEKVLATARFRDIGPTVSATTGAPGLTKEPVGPSSRATGMIFSEIMYHPAPRTDGRNLEFLEVHNARSVFEDLTGWRITGEVNFDFPAGFRLQAGETVVIAAVPDDLKAVYGITNVLGPYTGALANEGGLIRLRNNANAIRLEVEYSDNPPWPVSADGAGHSLVLARPSYGENDPRAWAACEFIGGSPGTLDPTVPAPETRVVINEFLAHTDDPVLDFIELHNRSNERVDVSGMVLTDDPATNRFRFPAGTFLEPRGFLSVDQSQLGFALNAAGETIYLVNAAGTRVLDALRFGGQENGVASGRSPDGAATIRRLAQPTPGAANAAWRADAVVINELMYNPITGENNDEFIELHNRGATPVILAGWRFVTGVDYTFPNNTTLPAGGYLVVAKNAAQLRANYPQLTTANCLGDYAGQLSNRGERLALGKPVTILTTNTVGQVETNLIHVVVSEVTYGDGGRWGEWADGGGSSLELIDPRADLLQPANWADSDETAKAPWTTVEFTGRVDNANGTANRLHVTLLGAGECLVDDIEAFRVGSTNVVNNGGFENGTTGWVLSGNHSTSAVVSSGAASGANCLRVRAQGDGDPGPNSLRNSLRSTLPGNSEVTLRARVRWLAGWPQALFRLHGNGLELAANLTVPRNLGTPGQANSRRVANAGPAIYDVAHNPPLPAANEQVRVTCRVSDPDGIASVQLRYRLDPATTLTTVTLRDNGTQGDELAGDGIYSGLLPGRGDGTLVAFRIIATDAAGTPASSTFPAGRFTEAGTQGQECLVRWGEVIPFGTFAHYHLWHTQATGNARQNALDNTWRDCTLVYGNYRVIYNTGFRDKGSPYHGGAGDIAATTPRDEPLLGTFDRVFASTGNGGSESTGIRSQLAAWYAQQLGIPYLHAHYMRLYFNGRPFRPDIMEDLEQPNHDYAEKWFPTDDEGDLYKVAVWFEFNDDNRGFNATGATIQRFTTTGGAYKLARYRWNWQRRSNDGDANNFAQFFDLVSAINDTSGSYVPRVLQQADMEQWMRAFCFDYAMGNWDAWTYNVGQNMYLYRPAAQRWVLIPWDIDFVFGLGDGTSAPLRGGGQDPTMSRAYTTPAFQRMNWRAYQDTINGPFLPENFQPQIDARRSALVKNGVTGITGPTAITTWINSRRNVIANQLNAADAKVFEITTNGGADFESPSPTVTLGGSAPFAVATIEVNGIPYPLTWSNVRTFNLTVPLTGVTNRLTLVGKDLRGNVVAGASDTIEVRYTGAIERLEDFVVINEVHYDAAAGELASTFIELFNRSFNTPFDLSGCVLQGVGYTFPAGAIIAPRSYLLLVGNRAGFEAVYGRNLPVFAEFTGSLDNDGERLALIKPGVAQQPDRLITDLRYWDRLPWPTNAAGLGPSLQLVDPDQGSWRVANWAATAANATDRTTPGRANSIAQTLPAFPPVWLNEVQPNNVAGPRDGAGDRDPWIELYNAGTNAVDLSPFYLTDSYTSLMRWQFPAGTTLGPGQFLVVWADGEPAESKPGELHTNFRLAPATGVVAFTRQQGSPTAPAVMDYVEYTQLSAGRSVGSYPDGEPRQRRQFVEVTPGAANNPALPTLLVRLNEIMAANTRTLADPADEDFDDWFELYNAGAAPADLSGYTLTDALDAPGRYTIPPGTVIPAGGFLLVWADGETGQNAPGRELHVNFSLARDGEQLGLFDLNGVLVDAVTFGGQADDVSIGRYPDGAAEPLFEMATPTPRQPNYLEGGNRPPVFTAIPAQAVGEGAALRFTAKANDPDAGQTLRYSLGPDAPPAATIDEVTGQFVWTPAEADGPGRVSFLIFATDNGTPQRIGSVRVAVDVAEVNLPPVLPVIPDQVADEGTLFTLQLAASDPDLPPNRLVFSLGPNAPEGATLSEDGGFAWTPSEALGSSTTNVNVRVTDDGQPPLSDARTFLIAVREIPNPPDVPFIDPQFVDEGATFQLQVTATDPDMPPSPLRFSFDQAPSGASIHPDTGLITWPTSEANGPTNAIFVVRVSEVNPPNQTTARTFSVNVRELNEAPALAPIADRTVSEGTLLVITNTATDSDLPPQRLTFSLAPGAPAGAGIDANSGVLTWAIGADAGPGTNVITVRVTDDAEDVKTASQTFTVVVVAEPKIVINEIMYRPAVTGAEYVELHNASTNTTWDLSGWLLTGTRYLFPAGTRLTPSGFLVVARDTARFTTAYGARTNLLGNYVNELGPDGGVIELYRSSAPTPETRVDRVAFRATAPWPAAANGQGPSLQLIDPAQDNARVANWAAVTRQSTNASRNLIPIEAGWRYWEAAEDPAPGWTNRGYSDTAWPSGKALLYVEGADLPAAKNTPLTLGQMSYLFRARFNFDGNPEGASLVLNTVLDDGAVFYLNGRPIYWLGMAEGEIPQRDTPATRTVGDAAYEGPFTIPVDNLRAGENVLAVEVHQTNPGSSDIVFGVSVDVLEVRRESYTPGYANSVRGKLEPFPAVGLNEVLAVNQTGIRDNAGDRDPWIELANYGAAPAVLDGWYLSDSYAALAKWPFPPGASLAAGQFKLVWADAEQGETTAAEWHTNFRLAVPAGVVVLSRLQNGQPAVVDFLEYSGLGADQSFGYPAPRLEDSMAAKLGSPTPGAANQTAPPQTPRVTGIQLGQAGEVTLRWTAVAGRGYRVEAAAALASDPWRNAGQVTATGPEAAFTDTGHNGAPAQYYRIVLLP
jgi:hypothetical protein